jgi:hypothetical protein
MKASDYRTNGMLSELEEASPKKSSPHLLPVGLGLGVVGLAVFGAILCTREAPAPPAPVGVEQEVVGQNKVVLRDYQERKWLSYFRDHSVMLSDPIWGERPYGIHSSCMGFVNYIVCRSIDPKDWGTIWEFQPLLLGTAYLPPGVQPNDKAELAYIVSQFVSDLERQGVDRFYWLGHVISPAFCSDKDGICYQVFQRQVVKWQNGATQISEVSISPLGQMAKDK